jgi:hypothetical protein
MFSYLVMIVYVDSCCAHLSRWLRDPLLIKLWYCRKIYVMCDMSVYVFILSHDCCMC